MPRPSESTHTHSCHQHQPTANYHRYYADLPKEKLAAFVVDESTPLTAHTLHQVAHDIHEFNLLKERLGYFLIYILAIVLFMGLNGALLLANLPSQTFIEDNYEFSFHMLSFWGVFAFTLVEAKMLISTGVASLNSMSNAKGGDVNRMNGCYSIIILLDVVFSFVSALLYTMDPEVFEVPAHYLEYSVQIPISCINLMFVEDRMLDRRRVGSDRTGETCTVFRDDGKVTVDEIVAGDNSSTPNARHGFSWFRKIDWSDVPSIIPLVLCLLQLLLYSGIISTGDMGPERSSHFCEFINEILNGLFALQYALHCHSQTQSQLNRHHI